jgi:hypothetical protein
MKIYVLHTAKPKDEFTFKTIDPENWFMALVFKNDKERITTRQILNMKPKPIRVIIMKKLYRCPSCGYYAFNGQYCYDCGYES